MKIFKINNYNFLLHFPSKHIDFSYILSQILAINSCFGNKVSKIVYFNVKYHRMFSDWFAIPLPTAPSMFHSIDTYCSCYEKKWMYCFMTNTPLEVSCCYAIEHLEHRILVASVVKNMSYYLR